jgi:HAD superfamily hydrolase (TIGR01662 family)
MREIVLVCGYPASGKTTHAKSFSKPYVRLSRDDIGGTTKGLAVRLQERIDAGKTAFVLDNTFPTIESRSHFIKVGQRNNIPVRCVWLKATCEESQLNASLRMIRKYGSILGPEEIKEKGKKDPGCFPAAPLFKYRKIFERPTLAEGLASIKVISFHREWPSEYKNKALILDYDGTLRTTKKGGKFPDGIDDIEILPNRKEVLQKYQDQGYILAGVSNQSWIGKGVLSWDQVNEGLEYTNDLLGYDIDFLFCPHSVPPIMCHCRKPQTGLGAVLIEKYKLNASESIYVGDQTSDKTFAKRCGFKFSHADDFFKG